MQSEIQDVINLQFQHQIDKDGKICEENIEVMAKSAKLASDTLEKILAQTNYIDEDIHTVFIRKA